MAPFNLTLVFHTNPPVAMANAVQMRDHLCDFSTRPRPRYNFDRKPCRVNLFAVVVPNQLAATTYTFGRAGV